MSDHVIYEELPGFVSDKTDATRPRRVIYGGSNGITSHFTPQELVKGVWVDITNTIAEMDLLEHALYRAVCELAKINNKSDWANPYHLKEKLIGEDIIF